MCVCVRVCLSLCAVSQLSQMVRASVYYSKGSGFDSWCGNFGVAVVSLSKKLYSHFSSLPSCINGGLVLTREAAHPALTSMYLVIRN